LNIDARLELILETRRSGSPPGARAGRAVAIVAHAIVIVVVALFPTWRQAQRAPLEFVAVQIVPAQRLGVEQPPPPQPQPEPTPVAPPPSVAAVKPAPTPKPVPASTPAAAPIPPAVVAPAPSVGSPQGSAQGALTGAAVAGLDNPDFTYGYYVDQMLSLIRGKWLRPPLGGGIEATVHFQIRRDGVVSDVRIVTSSGYSSFDLSGLRAVQAASPLPPLPKGYRQDTLGVTLIIR
jgi:TonB family protein